MKVHAALLSTLIGQRVYPMAEFTVESPSLETFKTHQDKLCNLIQPQRWPCFKQEIGLGKPQGSFPT